MIPKVGRRGRRVGGLLRYLFGPGRAEEHRDPHLVASWRGNQTLHRLEPPVRADGKRDFTGLVGMLEQPMRVGRHPPRLPVWHCSLRTAPGDRHLTDTQWAHIAAEVMAAVGLAPHGDRHAVRWVAVRHADNHIHLVATLVRQDGATAWAWKDKLRTQAACRDIEDRYGLRRVAPTDRTAARRPTPAEVAKARRLGRRRTPRDELRARVRTALAASRSEQEFAARLRDVGVLVEFRYSVARPDERTGYKVALTEHTTAVGGPVWYSGGQLAADLTLPRLRRRWNHPDTGADTDASVRVSPAARAQALQDAAAQVRAAADEITATATDPAAGQPAAQAAADTLVALAHTVEGTGGGPLSAAAELLDRAARDLYGRVHRATTRSYETRAMARLVYLMGRISGDEDTYAALALVLDLARFGDTLARLRDVQQRWHQAEDARHAATMLRTTAEGGRLSAPAAPVPAPTAAVDGGRPTTPTAPGTAREPHPQQHR